MNNISEAEFTQIVGGPGTGKTTMLHAIQQQNAGKWLIVDPTGNEPLWDKYPDIDITNTNELFKWKTGIRKTFFDEDDTFPAIFEAMRRNLFVNANLLFDDAATYAQGNIDKPLANICRLKRNKAIDIWSICHGLSEIPPKFFTFITKYIMFQTLDDPQRIRKNVPNFDLLMNVKQAIDNQGKINIHSFIMCDRFAQIIKKSF